MALPTCPAGSADDHNKEDAKSALQIIPRDRAVNYRKQLEGPVRAAKSRRTSS
jgi:hypothetical protein